MSEKLVEIPDVPSKGVFTTWKIKQVVILTIGEDHRVVAVMQDGRKLVYRKLFESFEKAAGFAKGVRNRGNIYLGHLAWTQKT